MNTERRERPILFKDEMIRAILEGRKTQTRRIVKGAPTTEVGHRLVRFDRGWNWQADQEGVYPSLHREIDDPMQCPYGKPGSHLWVKEAYGYKIRNVGGTPHEQAAYRATDPDEVSCYDCNGKEQLLLWRPAETMPRQASRITLEITDVRVERLQDISEADAKAEGVEPLRGGYWRHYQPGWTQHQLSAKGSFATLWDSINGHDSWDTNPWVWVIEFKRVTPEATQ